MSTEQAPNQPDYRIGAALVVEDDPILALSIEDILKSGGAPRVTVCSTTFDAMRALEREKPDVVILDIHLVDRDDGWALAELVTQIGATPPRIVFSTGNPGAIPASVAGLGTVLVKPYAPEALLKAARGSRRGGLLTRLRGAISPS